MKHTHGYSYIPRQFLVDANAFGQRIDATWRPFAPDDDRVAAAYYQHRAACQTQRIAGELRMSLADLANELRTNPDRLRRKLYGESPACLDEILSWVRGVDDATVLPELSSQNDLYPSPPD